MDKCSNNCVFVCRKLYVSSLFFELNSPVGTYVVSDLAHEKFLNLIILAIRLIILVVESVALVFCFFVLFGSFIKI
jgi:hypothetical protein